MSNLVHLHYQMHAYITERACDLLGPLATRGIYVGFRGLPFFLGRLCRCGSLGQAS